jgi:hypothetical protein
MERQTVIVMFCDGTLGSSKYNPSHTRRFRSRLTAEPRTRTAKATGIPSTP